MTGEERIPERPRAWWRAQGLRDVLTWIGLTGAGGGGFAALCFGIGFLATRNHDEMLGLPSQASASSVLVRTGAMFFSNSLYDALFGTWKALPVLAAIVLAAWWLARAARRGLRGSSVPNAGVLVAGGFVVAHLVLLGFGLLLFEDRAATLDASNHHLLLSRRPPDAAEAAPAVVTGPGAALRYFVSERLPAKATRVREELRFAPQAAHDHYGQSVALLAVFAALLALELAAWRDRSARVLDWTLRPALYLVGLVLVLTLPAAYGVLSISNHATWVEITSPPDRPVNGYLLTDISSDEPDVWTLAVADTNFSLRVFKRDRISEIRLMKDASTDNLLRYAWEGPAGSAAPSAQGGVAHAGVAEKP